MTTTATKARGAAEGEARQRRPVIDPRIRARRRDIKRSAGRRRLRRVIALSSALAAALQERFLGPLAPDACLGALATQRQRELLDELVLQANLLLELPDPCPPELAASALQGLVALLGRLTGEDRVESTLDQVFSGFCLGK